MSLFQVKGWDVKGDVIADKGKSKKNQKKPKKATNSNNNKGEASKEKPKDNKKNNNKKRNHKKMTEEKEESEGSDNEENSDLSEGEEEKEEQPQLQAKSKPSKSNPSEPAPKPASTKLTPLQQKMMMKLSGSRFRWINEQLYTTRSEEALQLIKDQPELFDAYHQGFRSQVQGWPENPVDVFVQEFKFRSKKPVNAPGGLPGIVNEDTNEKTVVIADMGCGEAQLSKDIGEFVKQFNGGKNKKFKKNDRTSRFNKLKKLNVEVHSFDLKKANDRITVADIKNVPLPDGSCSVVIFCLALMGTNFLDFVNEAYRLLAPRGELWIAEIKSRFNDVKDGKPQQGQGEEFVNALKLLGFFHKRTDTENKMFVRFEFFKPPPDILEERKQKLERQKKFIEVETEKEQLIEKREKNAEGNWLLKPCIYKRR
ncbi:25S rRNA (adenine645-N1)-methyltransferase [Saccharomycopsis crataegensis]|uniref:Ribosomal RNA-processing protein 8 n=1 Tax=Saccharomycopsis crataegensis TaxID=43959 RepID=A0AAV5QN15_9ASCO|nr:25S rRNA (adenine645-N1)-methyltransferase [Saccharomycopsis crataegensis]